MLEAEKDSKLKKKYVRSIIKLGNSKAITFPQEWTNNAKLSEKSEVILYPLDDKTIMVRAQDKDKEKITFKLDSVKWPENLIKQAIISAFKLNCDEVTVSYNAKTEDIVNQILIELGSELIGLDFKNLTDKKEFSINFLLDTSRKSLSDVLLDLLNVLTTIIKNIVSNIKKDSRLLLAEIDKKYSLGTRILITGLSDYPISKGYKSLPIIRYLGDRVILLYVRDFINEALNLEKLPTNIIKKYSDLLLEIPELLNDIIKNYENINLDSVSDFQKYLTKLENSFNEIKFSESNIEEQQVRNILRYYLNSLKNFFDIGITRLIESEIGMV